MIGTLALVLYGVTAIAGVVSATAGPYVGVVPPVNIGLPSVAGPTTTQTVTLTAPIAAGETLRVTTRTATQ